jgi:flagellar biosynthesis protein FlhG
MFNFIDSNSSKDTKKERVSSKAEIISITSGKGGVGKTMFSLNLGIEAVQLGKKTLILDGDLGMANIHILAGIYPDYDIMDVVNGKKTLEEVIIKGPGNVDIIPGSSGIFKLSNMSHQKRHALAMQLNKLDSLYDLIILDTEAGMSHNVLKFISISDRTIVVVTPDLTSLSDAYAIIKVVRKSLKNDNIGVVLNRVRSITEANAVFKKINMATEKFLNYSLKNYGFILEDPQTAKDSIQKRTPVSIGFTKTKLGNSLKKTANFVFGVQDKKIIEPSNVILNRFSMLIESVTTN